MAAARMIFEYKDIHGHRTEKTFPPGTEYDKHAQILCPVCLADGELVEAYLIFACPEKQKPE